MARRSRGTVIEAGLSWRLSSPAALRTIRTHAGEVAGTSLSNATASLRRLRTDWIDLYQVHHPQSDVPIDETLRALDDLMRAGKVRYIGGSNFAGWQLVESLWVATELGLNRFVSEQPPYHLLDRRRERELVPMAQTYGIALLPWSPLASGFLSGKYRRNSAFAETFQTLPEKRMGRAFLYRRQFRGCGRPYRVGSEQGMHTEPARVGLVHAAAGYHQPDHRPAHYGAA